MNRGKIEGRLDTVFYKPLYLKNEEAIKSCNWGYEKLNFLAQRLVDGPFGSDLKVDEYQPSGIPLLRVSNIRTGEVEGNLVFISDEKQLQLKRSTVLPNDVLLTKAGAILGYSAVFPEHLKQGNITSHLVAITCKKTINPYYLSHYFRCNIGQLQIYRWGNKSTRPELNTSEVKNILITLPPLDIQGEIVDKMEAAYNQRKQKETEAAALLASIDGYLLQALGITLPPPSEKKTYFISHSNHLTGMRFDPFYHQVEYENIDLVLQNANAKVHTLGHLTVDLKNGAEFRTYSDSGYRYLRVSDLSQHGITNKNMRFVDVPEIPERLKLNQGCILISRSGSLGLVNVVTDEIMDSILSSHIFKVQLNTKLILPSYLENYLRSIVGQKQIFRNNNGGVIPELNQSALRSIKIVLPSIEKQTEIADHISVLRSQAKQLQQQAAAELAHAKQQVEQLILGVKNHDF